MDSLLDTDCSICWRHEQLFAVGTIVEQLPNFVVPTGILRQSSVGVCRHRSVNPWVAVDSSFAVCQRFCQHPDHCRFPRNPARAGIAVRFTLVQWPLIEAFPLEVQQANE